MQSFFSLPKNLKLHFFFLFFLLFILSFRGCRPNDWINSGKSWNGLLAIICIVNCSTKQFVTVTQFFASQITHNRRIMSKCYISRVNVISSKRQKKKKERKNSNKRTSLSTKMSDSWPISFNKLNIQADGLTRNASSNFFKRVQINEHSNINNIYQHKN